MLDDPISNMRCIEIFHDKPSEFHLEAEHFPSHSFLLFVDVVGNSVSLSMHSKGSIFLHQSKVLEISLMSKSIFHLELKCFQG